MSRITHHRAARRLFSLLAAGTLAAASLTACSASTEHRTFCDTGRNHAAEPGPTSHAVIVAGDVANAPAPALTSEWTEDLTARYLDGARFDLVSTGGDGYICPSEKLGLKPAGDPKQVNEQARADHAATGLRRIAKEITMAPRADGADLFSALQLAGDQLQSVGADTRLVIILASGLNDHGYLDFTVPGALGADVDDVVKSLKAAGPLPRLEGAEVIVIGLGYTSEPQEALRPIDRKQLTDIYTAVLQESGATSVEIDPIPLNGSSVDTLGTTVGTVEVPTVAAPTPSPVDSCTPQTQVYDQASGVRFNPSQATFVDEKTARETLEPVISWLAADPSRTVEIQGTTARWGTREGQITQGQQRADAVAALLHGAGVSPSQIAKSEGLGSYFPEYLPDVKPSGEQDPGPAALNRSIRLTLHETC